VRLLDRVHQEHGQLDWATLFQPAIQLAEAGFTVSPRLARLIRFKQSVLRRYPTAAAYFFDAQGQPLQAGTQLQNPDFAATLRTIAQDRSAGFYEGAIASDIVQTVQATSDNPGLLSLDDLASYEAIERPPVCTVYRVYQICGMGPPSSGGITVAQILGILNQFELATLTPESWQAWYWFGEASRLAFADRGLYLADPDFVSVPTETLLQPEYLEQRAALIRPEGPILEDVEAGALSQQQSFALGLEWDSPSTTHISIVDREGNAVSLTSSIEGAFGSQVMVRGFMLNNQLTDFSFLPKREGRLVANRVEPGKRPRSSMAPTIVLDQQNNLRLVVGSPGGSRIIGYVAKTLIAHLDWGMDIQAAIDLPNRVNRFGMYDLEQHMGLETLQTELEALGYKTRIRSLNSGLHGIAITEDGLQGGADPRREGIVLGE
jgi:gamma-glutamyltranspeptidase/glutathione hydrolase